jgi:GTPase SAR1 family protein
VSALKPGNEGTAERSRRDAHVVFLVYSIAHHRFSFDMIRRMHSEVTRIKGSDPKPHWMYLVGNKNDCVPADRAVSQTEGQALAHALGCELFFETSRHTAVRDLDEILTAIIRKLRKAYGCECHAEVSLAQGGRRGLRERIKSCIRRIFQGKSGT